MGPTPASAVLTVAEKAIAVTFRLPTLRPLEYCLYALQATIPHLSCLALRRRRRRLPLPVEDGQSPQKKKVEDHLLVTCASVLPKSTRKKTALFVRRY